MAQSSKKQAVKPSRKESVSNMFLSPVAALAGVVSETQIILAITAHCVLDPLASLAAPRVSPVTVAVCCMIPAPIPEVDALLRAWVDGMIIYWHLFFSLSAAMTARAKFIVVRPVAINSC